MAETQESQGCSFSLKVCMLMTQGEAIFQVKSKDRKKSQCPGVKEVSSGRSGRLSVLFRPQVTG